MSPRKRLALLAALATVFTVTWSASSSAQIFYPGYPVYRYGGVDGSIRVEVKPREAEVYVDGYYAGIVDDFDGVFQRLRVRPGEHSITVYRDGFRPLVQRIYVQPNTTFRIRERMEVLPPGEMAPPRPLPPPPDPRVLAQPYPGSPQGRARGRRQPGYPPGPPPAYDPNEPPFPNGDPNGPPDGPDGRGGLGGPDGSMPPPPPNAGRPYPQGPPQGQPQGGPFPGQPQGQPPGAAAGRSGNGTLLIRVQPADAEVLIDGQPSRGADGQDRVMVDMSEGRHNVQIRKAGYVGYLTDVSVRRGETTNLDVSLRTQP